MTYAAFVSFAERIAAGPYRYDTGAGRCDPIHSGYADCSGLVVASLRAAGAHLDCTGSFALSRACHRAASGLSMGAARATRGALLFIGANQGQGALDGSEDGVWPGHVAISRGDGTIVEARNHAAGILTAGFDGRGWVYAASPSPWLGGPSPSPSPGPSGNPVLREGSSGPPVRWWQALLNGYAGQHLVVDGSFGPATDAGTRAFQNWWRTHGDNQMTVDGIVGPHTWAMMEFTAAVHH